jgi:hypothetical protein
MFLRAVFYEEPEKMLERLRGPDAKEILLARKFHAVGEYVVRTGRDIL